MPSIQHLFRLIDAYRLARDVSDARVSTLLFNDGGRIGELRSGGDIGTRRLDRAIQWFSDNWPDKAEWAADIDRPAPTERVA